MERTQVGHCEPVRQVAGKEVKVVCWLVSELQSPERSRNAIWPFTPSRAIQYRFPSVTCAAGIVTEFQFPDTGCWITA